MAKEFDVQPRVPGRVTIGSTKGQSVIWAGTLAEKGNKERIQFDASESFVVLEVGKRGSGKSYGMGALLESFATVRDSSVIATHKERRGVVILDPLDTHWPALIPLAPEGPPALKAQYQALKFYEGLEAEPVHVKVFMPAGYENLIDHHGFSQYQIPVNELSASDWALLLKTDLMTEPRGRLVDEAYMKVTRLGWQSVNGSEHPPVTPYSIADLIECIEQDAEIDQVYDSQTRRSVVQPFRSFSRMPLFNSSSGTPLTEVVRAGVLSILSLGRLPEDIKTVLTTVFVRTLRSDRMTASQVLRRLSLCPDDHDTRKKLEAELARHVPKTVLAIDEAQILIPTDTSSMARKALESYVLEGRNYGLSLWLATQRPKGAISDRAISQIDTFIVHRLSIADDIKAVCGLLQSSEPEKIRLNGEDLNLGDMIRRLEVGQAIFSSATSSASRLVVGQIRPRMVAHGGEAF